MVLLHQHKDMIRGLEEEVARRDVEAEERLAEKMAEGALKTSQALFVRRVQVTNPNITATEREREK